MRIGITIGDPAGIGPEVILKALQRSLGDGVEPVIFGSRQVLERTDRLLVKAVSDYQPLIGHFDAMRGADDSVAQGALGLIEVLPNLDASDIPFGERDPRAAQLQLAAFHSAVTAIQEGHIQAIVTAPWTKELFRTIDMPPVGHTEILAEAFDAPDHVMMLAGPALRVALVTTHVPLVKVGEHLTHERLEAVIRTTAADLTRLFGIGHPHIAVCGLNPHAGEFGVMGVEEGEIIRPVVNSLAAQYAQDFELSGPYASDTLFARYRGARQPFDAVVCMYHDQGLIPLKLLHFGESANITLGLPVVRTSVDHGTAYDIAGWGVADAGSMRYALELAISLARRISK
jgi:4-phospho-D-threonate 3-dehydrogenase / 4-phospho-D-erythronate 3-dehydrogenase